MILRKFCMRSMLISQIICFNPNTSTICSNNIPSNLQFLSVYDILVNAWNVTSIIHEPCRQNLFWTFELGFGDFFLLKTNVIWNFKLLVFSSTFQKWEKDFVFFFSLFPSFFFCFVPLWWSEKFIISVEYIQYESFTLHRMYGNWTQHSTYIELKRT